MHPWKSRPSSFSISPPSQKKKISSLLASRYDISAFFLFVFFFSSIGPPSLPRPEFLSSYPQPSPSTTAVVISHQVMPPVHAQKSVISLDPSTASMVRSHIHVPSLRKFVHKRFHSSILFFSFFFFSYKNTNWHYTPHYEFFFFSSFLSFPVSFFSY